MSRLADALDRDAPTMAVTFAGPVDPEVVQDVARLQAIAEFRADALGSNNTRDIAREIRKLAALPLILTIRSEEEKGGWRGSEAKRAKLYRDLISMADGADVGLNAARVRDGVIKVAHDQGKIAIASEHFDDTPSNRELRDKIGEAWEVDADYVKLAVTIKSDDDWEQYKEFGRSFMGEAVILVAMGNDPAYRLDMVGNGSLLTYASADDVPVATGQMKYDLTNDGLRARYPAYAQFIQNHQPGV